MPVQSDALVRGSLLMACWAHGDVERAERVRCWNDNGGRFAAGGAPFASAVLERQIDNGGRFAAPPWQEGKRGRAQVRMGSRERQLRACGKAEGESDSLGIFAEGREAFAERDSLTRRMSRLLDVDFNGDLVFLQRRASLSCSKNLG